MRVAAILGPNVKARTVERFAAPGVELERVAGFQPLPPGPWDAALIFGGDGTVHLHLRELHERGIPMLAVPVGSGNDFADAVGIGSVAQAEAAWRQFCRGGAMVREIDLGKITPVQGKDSAAPPGLTSENVPHSHGLRRGLPSAAASRLKTGHARVLTTLTGDGERPTGNAVLFCCIGGAGLDAQTNRRANRMVRWVRGHGGYVLAAIAEIAKWQAVEMKVEFAALENANPPTRPAQPAELTRDDNSGLSGRATLVAFANANTYGHGMKMAPRAQMDDGKLDVVFVKEASKRRLLTFFPTVFSGTHIDMPEVEYRQTDWLRLEAERPMAVYADGEYVCDTPVEVRVLPRALRVIVPAQQKSATD